MGAGPCGTLAAMKAWSMRSKLFVPGARPELFAKALAGEADALSFDLEDSVIASRKAEARGLVGDLLRSGSAAGTTKLLIVRCNAPDSGHYLDDLEMVLAPTLGLLNLPKIESPAQLRAAIAPIERAEERLGLPPVRLLVNIETPAGLRHAAEIAAADPRVAGLQLGLGDLFEPQGIDRRSLANVHAAQFALRMAAAEAGVFAIDSAFAGLDDAAGFEAEARSAHALGFLGKSCIHPKQVALAHAAFTASEAELAGARRIAEAARAAEDAGHGAVSVDGRMIDLPYLRRAQALVAPRKTAP
jgi:citrate lyase subunit beta/citryl-CoA lyase